MTHHEVVKYRKPIRILHCFVMCHLSTGHSANCLTPHVGDANTMIPEFKAFLVDVKKKA